MAEQGPFDLDAMAAVWRASGFPAFDPDEPLLTPADVDTFRAFVDGTELFGEDALLQFTRVMGAALASIADAAMASFGLNLVASLTESGASELEYARATANATGVLLEGVPQAMVTMFLAPRRDRRPAVHDDAHRRRCRGRAAGRRIPRPGRIHDLDAAALRP